MATWSIHVNMNMNLKHEKEKDKLNTPGEVGNFRPHTRKHKF